MKTFTTLSGFAALAAAAPFFPTGFPAPTAGGAPPYPVGSGLPPPPYPIPTGSGGIAGPLPTGGFPSGPWSNGTFPQPGAPHPSGHHPPGPPPQPYGTAPPAPVGTAPAPGGPLVKRQFGWPSFSFSMPAESTGGFGTGSGSGFGAGSGFGGGFGGPSGSASVPGFPSASFPAAAPSMTAFGFGQKRQLPASFTLPAFTSGSQPALPSFSLPGQPSGSISFPSGPAPTLAAGGPSPTFKFLSDVLPAPTMEVNDMRGYQGHISAGHDAEPTSTSTTSAI